MFILCFHSGKIKWSQSDREFNKIEDLVDHHMLVEEKLPCRLVLPEDIMKAKNIRELQSLAVLEEGQSIFEEINRGNSILQDLLSLLNLNAIYEFLRLFTSMKDA